MNRRRAQDKTSSSLINEHLQTGIWVGGINRDESSTGFENGQLGNNRPGGLLET
jgi:hypothetical protein